MNLPDFLMEAPYGEILLKGHRIGLYHVVRLFKDGHDATEIAEEFPTLPLRLVQQVVDFYRSHRDEVDAYVAWEEAELAKQEGATRHQASLDDLRRRAAQAGKVEVP